MNVRAINHPTILKKSDTKYCSLLKTTIKDKHFHELVTSVREKKYSWCEIQLQTSGCICLHKHHQRHLMMYEGLIVLSHFIRGDLNHYPLQLFSEGQGGNRKPGVGIQIGNGIKWEESTAMLAAHWAWMIRPVVLWAKCKQQHANMLKMTRKSHFENLETKSHEDEILISEMSHCFVRKESTSMIYSWLKWRQKGAKYSCVGYLISKWTQ